MSKPHSAGWRRPGVIVGRDAHGNIIVEIAERLDLDADTCCSLHTRFAQEHVGVVIRSQKLGWDRTRLLMSATFTVGTLVVPGLSYSVDLSPPPRRPTWPPIAAILRRGAYAIEVSGDAEREQIDVMRGLGDLVVRAAGVEFCVHPSNWERYNADLLAFTIDGRLPIFDCPCVIVDVMPRPATAA